MASKLEYRQIKGRDEEIPVFRNLSRSVVKRGADKIYWRLKDAAAKRFGSWDDGVWLDCETGEIRFGERCVKESWNDYYDGAYSLARYEDPFSRDFCSWSYLRLRQRAEPRVYSWYLGSLSEWRGPDAEIEPRLAARLAEAAEFNFGLDFAGPEEAHPFLAEANEVARFYETRARYRREEKDAPGKNGAEDAENGVGDSGDEASFRYCESAAFDEWEAQEKRNQTSDAAQEYDYWENGDWDAFDKNKNVAENKGGKEEGPLSEQEEYAEWEREYHYEREAPVCLDVRKNERDGENETPSKILFSASPLALVPRYWEREREIENADPKPTAPKASAAQDAEAWRDYWTADRERDERIKTRINALTCGFNFCEYRADESPFLGSLDELIAAVVAGTSSEGEEPSDGGTPATRSDALSDDWRERLPSLLEYRLDRCNALFSAAKTLYVAILGRKVREMKRVGVWVPPGGDDVELGSEKPGWLKIGTLDEIYEKKRGIYWGAGVNKESKIFRKDDARHWLSREIGRRLEAALKAAS